MARVEQQHDHLLAPRGAQPFEQQQRVARGGDRRAVIWVPPVGQLPDRLEPRGSLRAHAVVAHEATPTERATLPHRYPRHARSHLNELRRRRRAADRPCDELCLTELSDVVGVTHIGDATSHLWFCYGRISKGDSPPAALVAAARTA